MPHTPGPWRVSGDYGNKDQHPNLTIESDFGQITKVLSENCDVDEQVIADAKLIAAAPDLLAACNAFLKAMTNPDHLSAGRSYNQAVDDIRAAVAKATK